MLKSLHIVILLLYSANLFGQNLEFDWAFSQRRSTHYDREIHVDHNQNIILTTNTLGTTDVDPGVDTVLLSTIDSLQEYPTIRGVIQKLDESKQFLWAVQVPGRIYSSAIDSYGDVYVVGQYEGNPDFDPTEDTLLFLPPETPYVYVEKNAFISKFSSNGEFLWAKSIGSNSNDHAEHIVIDNNDNIIVGGIYGPFYDKYIPDKFQVMKSDSIDLNPNSGVQMEYSIGYHDIFLIKLDPHGEFLWGKSFGSEDPDIIQGLDVNSNGEVYTLGDFGKTFFINPDSDVPYFDEIPLRYVGGFIQRLNSQGEFISGYRMDQLGFASNQTIKVDNNNDIIITGTFIDSIDFGSTSNPQPLTSPNEEEEDLFMVKMNSNYKTLWSFALNGKRKEEIKKIVVDNHNSIYSIGTFNQRFSIFEIYNPKEMTIDFDPSDESYTLSSLGDQDAFIYKIDSSGQFEWVKQYGGTSRHDYGNSIDIDEDGNIYAIGIFADLVDFNPGYGEYNLGDGIFSYQFVTKLSNSCGNSIPLIDTVLACDSYTWIDGIEYTESNYTSTFNFPTINGCDSLILLNLTLNSGEILPTESELTFSQDNLTYQWLDCTNKFEAIPNQTEQHFIPNQNGMYAVETSINGLCVDTSECINYGLSSDISLVFTSSNNTISINSKNALHGEIFNINGQLIVSFTKQKEEHLYLNFNKQPGVYFLRAINDLGEQETIKFIKTQ